MKGFKLSRKEAARHVRDGALRIDCQACGSRMRPQTNPDRYQTYRLRQTHRAPVEMKMPQSMQSVMSCSVTDSVHIARKVALTMVNYLTQDGSALPHRCLSCGRTV